MLVENPGRVVVERLAIEAWVAVQKVRVYEARASLGPLLTWEVVDKESQEGGKEGVAPSSRHGEP